MDKDFGQKYKMPNFGNMSAHKFGDIDWRDDISESELNELFNKMGKNEKFSSTSTTTTTTTKGSDGNSITKRVSSYFGAFGNGMPMHERIKRAEIRAKQKMMERELKTKSSTSRKNENVDIGAVIRQQMNGQKMDNWNGPRIKGFDHENLSKFVDEMLEYSQNEFDKRLENELKEAKGDGIVALTKLKLRQNAERTLFGFTHKIRGIMARGMLRKMKDD